MAANSLWTQYKTANVAIKLIVINVVVFILLNLIPRLFGINVLGIVSWLALDGVGTLIIRPWTIITYAFLHADFWHIFWNMLILYWFSNYILNLFNGKRLLTVYFLGAIFGGLLYVVSYAIFPGLRAEDAVYTGLGLRGASAAVTAITIFIATVSRFCFGRSYLTFRKIRTYTIHNTFPP